MLHRRSVVYLSRSQARAEIKVVESIYLDTIFTCRGDNLATVKLQCSDAMIVFDGIGNTTCPQIPYLRDSQPIDSVIKGKGGGDSLERSYQAHRSQYASHQIGDM